MSPRRRYRFGLFELDTATGELTRDGRPVPLQDLPTRLLAALIERPGEVVSRQELQTRLWPPGHHLDLEAGLNTAVRRVREALGDEAGQPRFVATVPRRGYRFVAPVQIPVQIPVQTPVETPVRTPVQTSAEALVSPSVEQLPPGASRPARPIRAVVAGSLLAGAVVAALLLRPVTRLLEGPETGGVDRAAAEELYLLARHHAARRTREGLEKAIAAYQSSLARQPDQARAYGGLAAAYALLGAYDYWPPREAIEPARVMVERALELDADTAETQVALAWVRLLGEWDWAGAGAALDRAVALDPESSDVRVWRGSYLSGAGRHDEAIAELELAVALEPTSAVARTALAWHLFYAGRFEEAVEASERAIDVAPDHYDAWDNLKWIEITRGRPVEALIAWARAEDLDRGARPGREREFLEAGLPAMLRRSIESKMETIAAARRVPPYDLAIDHAALGEVESALDWLERSLADRETDLVGVAIDPRLEILHGHPRFERVVHSVGVPVSGAVGADSGTRR